MLRVPPRRRRPAPEIRAAGWERSLNERGVPSPGVYDRERNPHRSTAVWTLRTVAAILANPRDTGRQMWNRQFTDHREAVPGDKRSSRGQSGSGPRSDWVVSDEPTHPALISDADYLALHYSVSKSRNAQLVQFSRGGPGAGPGPCLDQRSRSARMTIR